MRGMTVYSNNVMQERSYEIPSTGLGDTNLVVRHPRKPSLIFGESSQLS